MSILAALLFALSSVGVCAFLVAVMLGAPWTELTFVGRWKGRLPVKVRFTSFLSLLLLGGFSTIVLARAGFEIPFNKQDH